MHLLSRLVQQAYASGASDLHLEPGMPPAMRLHGQLKMSGDPVSGQTLLDIGRGLVGQEGWALFLERRSLDLSRTIAGVRCRINLFQTCRGVGLALRLLTAFQATIDTLNLHPSLRELVLEKHGLVLVSGPTGCGKSTTIAALVQEINLCQPCHIITIEQPIEHLLRPARAFIRQREVGRDTPTFEQALLDALREDPDVLVVGEIRRQETMRLALSAAETGHMVFTTMHSSSVTETLQRLVSAFAPQQQPSVCAQLAECLVAVVCQRLVYRPDLGIRVPECEILRNTGPVTAILRTTHLQKLETAITTGAADGMWTRERYRRWLDTVDTFNITTRRPKPFGEQAVSDTPPSPSSMPPTPVTKAPEHQTAPAAPRQRTTQSVYELDGDVEDLGSILKEMG